MTFIDFIILCLATIRVTLLVTTDTITAKYREKIWEKYPPETSMYGYLITCNWCSSMYCATAIMSWYTLFGRAAMFVCAILALSTVAGFTANRAN